MRRTEKENQHYVPKFFLKNFSVNKNERQIGIFNNISEFYIPLGKLKTQARKPFFYGEDGEIEDTLSKMEDAIAPTIKKIINYNIIDKHLSEDYLLMQVFVVLMQLRNPRMAKIANEIVEKFIKSASRHFNESDFLDNFKIEGAVGQDIGLSLSSIKEILNVTDDLKCKLIKNETSIPFITSDNPCISYNQFLEKKAYTGSMLAFAAKGLQIFLPISPRHLILFYDPWAYRLGDKLSNVIEVKNFMDIDKLNSLQFLYCDSLIFFDNMQKEKLISYKKQSAKYLKEIITSDENVIVSGVSRSMKMELVFIKLTKQAKQYIVDNQKMEQRKGASKYRGEKIAD